MTRNIQITAGEVSGTAILNNSATANAIWDALPFEGRANRWGKEIYFTIPVNQPEANDARQDMAIGELGYWPMGKAFCIFFGPTPVSEGEIPRAYSNVNPFGHVEGDPEVYGDVEDGENVKVSRVEP